MLSKKDYKAVVKIIKKNRTTGRHLNNYDKGRKDVLSNIAIELADYFEQNSLYFDGQKFLADCFRD